MNSISAELERLFDEFESAHQTLNLPPIEIDKFDGNPRHYTSFMASFRQCVESITSDNHTRLS